MSDLQDLLNSRFSDADQLEIDEDSAVLRTLAARGSCRAFTEEPVPLPLLEVLCAAALASPTKSDLQQRDIIVVQSEETHQQLAELVAGQVWVANAPVLMVFCGNNRRQRLLHEWHGVPFANDHLDAFFNAAGDAAIAMGAFVMAAESVGLGCCPISAVRNEAEKVSELLGLPQHVFPFAGLAVGYPRAAPKLSKRLPLRVTCHVDRYCEDGLREAVAAYDADRAESDPYGEQRFPKMFGQSDSYGWSDDKVRQYSQPERAVFGDYVRRRGFRLD